MKLNSLKYLKFEGNIIKRYSSNIFIKYEHLIIEKKWQNYWNNNKIFQSKRRKNYQKKYILDMFPYPSGKLIDSFVKFLMIFLMIKMEIRFRTSCWTSRRLYCNRYFSKILSYV